MIYLFIIVIIVIVSIKIIELKNKEKEKGKETPFPYKKNKYLFSLAERSFYNVLEKITSKENYLLFSKVRMEDLLWIPRSIPSKERFGWRNRIKSRHVDFLICDKENISPLLVIELDDSSHNTIKAKQKDNFVDKVFKDAKIPLLRVKAKKYYSEEEVLKEINQKLFEGKNDNK